MNNGLEVSVDEVSPAQWAACLDEFADANIFQTWSYGAKQWGARNLSHLILRRSGVCVAGAQLRIIQVRRPSMGIAYLRWGPLCHRKGTEFDPALLATMAEALIQEYVRKRGLFLRVLPNSFIGTPRGDAFAAAFSAAQAEKFRDGDSYRTIVMDLSDPLDVLRKRLDQKWRNQLNKAEKMGLEVVEGVSQHEFDDFAALYDEMMSRKQFAATSDVRDYARMQETLPPTQRLRVLICRHEGRLAAGLVGSCVGDTGSYMYGATNEVGMKCKAAYFLQWRHITRLKEMGIRYYNLGGINPVRNPGVYHFKSGMSGADVLYTPPFSACERLASTAFARLAWRMQGPVRRLLGKVRRKR